jgi:DNA-binding PadR family transcriptional regulator
MTAAAVLMGGHVDTMLLKVISMGDCYGYSIAKTLSDLTHRALDIKEATLYAGLRRLEAEGLVNAYWGDETQGGRRKYYTISERGRAALRENISRWLKTKHIMDKILNWEEGSGNERAAH